MSISDTLAERIGSLFPLKNTMTTQAATNPTSDGGDSASNLDKPVDKPVEKTVARVVEQIRANQDEHRRLSVPRDSGVRDVWSTSEDDDDDSDVHIAKDESSDDGERAAEPTDSEPTEEIGGNGSVGHDDTATGKERGTIVASIEHTDTNTEDDRNVPGAQIAEGDGVMAEQVGREAAPTHPDTVTEEGPATPSEIAESQSRDIRTGEEEGQNADTTDSNAEPEVQKVPEAHGESGEPTTPQDAHDEERVAHEDPNKSPAHHPDTYTVGGLKAAVESAVAAVAADNQASPERHRSRPSGKRKKKAPPAKPERRLVLAEEVESDGDSADSEHFVVSRISDHRMFKGVPEVYVHWVGYKGQETWERESVIQETASIILFKYWDSVGGRGAHAPYAGKPDDYGVVFAIRGHYWELCRAVVPGLDNAEGVRNEDEDSDGEYERDGGSAHPVRARAGKRKAGTNIKRADKRRKTKSVTKTVASQTLCLWVEWLGWAKPTVVAEDSLRKTHPKLIKLYWDRVPGGRPLPPPKTGKV
ncbi:hypothetical protein B0H67DRAFT_263956 [Lasiosphaeris hirsuta]|uniref:Chromo domain-containing protein n=1 Tax=Lasiosphaeris hirsuta TaxID=260670 RepID=A0AA40DSV5_9PEZI|nr:hypothetical protein B0H67DRAFT_263956 [Lasiosphaeris hirsuta]